MMKDDPDDTLVAELTAAKDAADDDCKAKTSALTAAVKELKAAKEAS